MRIEILAVDRLRAGWARAAMRDYLGRIERYRPVARRDVKPGRGDGAVEDEGDRLLAAASIGPRDRLVAVDPGGESLASEGWAGLVAAWEGEGVARAVFAVGGAEGLAPAVLAAAARRLALGPQTLAHELAQVVLAEQLYRALTILRGEPYHR